MTSLHCIIMFMSVTRTGDKGVSQKQEIRGESNGHPSMDFDKKTPIRNRNQGPKRLLFVLKCIVETQNKNCNIIIFILPIYITNLFHLQEGRGPMAAHGPCSSTYSTGKSELTGKTNAWFLLIKQWTSHSVTTQIFRVKTSVGEIISW